MNSKNVAKLLNKNLAHSVRILLTQQKLSNLTINFKSCQKRQCIFLSYPKSNKNLPKWQNLAKQSENLPKLGPLLQSEVLLFSLRTLKGRQKRKESHITAKRELGSNRSRQKEEK